VAAKTKSVGGTEYPASAFAFVGDPQDTSTWHLLVADKAHVEDALARFNQTDLPADAKAKVAKKLVSLAKKFGIDASGFASEHGVKTAQAAADESYEDQQEELDQALLDGFGLDTSGYRRFCLMETFPDYVIARGPDGELYQIPYTEDEATDEIKFGEPQQVETAYVPVQQSAELMAAEAKTTPEEDGWTWPVKMMKAGWAAGSVGDAPVPHYFPREVVAEIAQAANGGRFRRRHPQGIEGDGSGYPELTAGWTSEASMQGDSAMATLHLLKSETELRDKLMAAREAGKLDLYGVSIFAYVGFRAGTQDGKKALIGTRLGKYVSLDLCAEAGAGGKIMAYAASRPVFAEISELQKNSNAKASADGEKIRKAAEVQASLDAAAAVEKAKAAEAARTAEAAKVAAAKKNSLGTTRGETGPAQTGRNKGAHMKDRILKVLETLRKFDAGRADELKTELDTIEDDKHPEFLAKVVELVGSQETEVRGKGEKLLAEMELRLCKMSLEEQVTEAKLPAEGGKLVREHMLALGRVWTEDETKGEIKRVREAFAAYSKIGRLSSEGAVRIGRDTTEKVQLAFDAMMGVKEAKADKTVHPFRGLREAFQEITGIRDHADFFTGGFYTVKETVLTTDFPNILKNSMTKRLIQDYAEVGMGGIDQLISETDVNDFKTQDRTRMGYYGDLPTVAENVAYAEFTKPTDEIINYAVAKRGGFQDITWETIMNDDLGKISSFAPRVARAARRTLKQFITDFFVTNPNFDPDSVAWFHASHSNLGATALSSAELDTRSIGLAKQSEKDSAKRLGLPLEWIMVPVDLRPTAHQINTNQSGTNNWVNRFGANDERIIVNELMSDVNDWVGGSLPGTAPFLEIAYLQGFRTPQIFIVPVEQRRAITAIDKMQLYGIYVFGGDIIDYRPVFKDVV
jgi:hypothetical protein